MGKTKILIVEDEFLVAKALEETLEEHGYEVIPPASNAMEAVRLATTHAPDLVLMDVYLGKGTDGVEAATYIHRDLAIPIVFVTSYSDTATLERAEAAEPLGYLSKPYRTADLLKTITIALRQDAKAKQMRQEQDAQNAQEQEGGVRGRLENIGGAAAAVQMVTMLYSLGKLIIGDDGGALYFGRGRIIGVEHPTLEGKEAVHALLKRKQGIFRFEADAAPAESNLNLDPMALLLSLSTHEDEREDGHEDGHAAKPASDDASPEAKKAQQTEDDNQASVAMEARQLEQQAFDLSDLEEEADLEVSLDMLPESNIFSRGSAASVIAQSKVQSKQLSDAAEDIPTWGNWLAGYALQGEVRLQEQTDQQEQLVGQGKLYVNSAETLEKLLQRQQVRYVGEVLRSDGKARAKASVKLIRLDYPPDYRQHRIIGVTCYFSSLEDSLEWL